MWYQVKSYLLFLWRSKNKHSVHSPFIFDLLTKCIRHKSNGDITATEAKFDALASKDNRSIQVTDLGAGSGYMGDNRTLSAIFKIAGIKKKQRTLLRKLIPYLEIRQILELGTSVGKATVTMANVSKTSVVTVEGCTNTAHIAQEYFDQLELKNIEVYNKPFNQFLSSNTQSFDLVYLDGGHNKEQTLANFEGLLPLIHNNSLILLDDIYWSPQMTEVWQLLCQHPRVTVSIDSYNWGWLFFRKEQPKQHFVLRL